MLNLDVSEQNILSMTEDTEITLTIYSKTDTYHPVKEPDDNWELYSSTQKDCIYGLSCDNLKEMRAALFTDYARGIITKAELTPSTLTQAPTI